ncbi:MAG: MFS transporter, partial [Ilumatobacteraceae bacterium]|nr:MFS transporter [Ilumatobacteraceae bacterium]
AMQAILFQLVGPDLLPSAVAANSTINSMSRLIGPAIAGVLIATVGIGTCFFVNAASYFVVIAALVGLRTNELVDRPLAGRTKGKLREGFAYVRSQPDVRRTLLVMAVVGTVALNFQTTTPSMVRFEFDLGAGSIGIAMSVSAIGSILGGIYIAGVTPHPVEHSPSPSPSSRSPAPSWHLLSPRASGHSSRSASHWGLRRHRSNR